ncbi:hypothetical protein QBC34DRAFT_183810 [Podospora aff. communis PSN243]|uniref:Uncharacterized protein n=1 Tax=Podospora aff. communis PSN243 TaxID=3040156 RepID=A0AAV9G8A1_9PEZI|nr:hypothetical protein QBC34DRAFT_183810 [Podospora aff. communis PSN243]
MTLSFSVWNAPSDSLQSAHPVGFSMTPRYAVITTPDIPANCESLPRRNQPLYSPQFHQSHSTTHPHRMAILHPDSAFSHPPWRLQHPKENVCHVRKKPHQRRDISTQHCSDVCVCGRAVQQACLSTPQTLQPAGAPVLVAGAISTTTPTLKKKNECASSRPSHSSHRLPRRHGGKKKATSTDCRCKHSGNPQKLAVWQQRTCGPATTAESRPCRRDNQQPAFHPI